MLDEFYQQQEDLSFKLNSEKDEAFEKLKMSLDASEMMKDKLMEMQKEREALKLKCEETQNELNMILKEKEKIQNEHQLIEMKLSEEMRKNDDAKLVKKTEECNLMRGELEAAKKNLMRIPLLEGEVIVFLF